MRPDVGAVMIHENGDIADHADGAIGAIFPERSPLLVEGELQGAADAYIDGQFLPRFRHRGRLPLGELLRPMVPRCELSAGAEGIEQNEIVEPPLIVAAKGFETI